MTHPNQTKLLDYAERTAHHHIDPVLDTMGFTLRAYRKGTFNSVIEPELARPSLTLQKGKDSAPLLLVLPLPNESNTPSPFFVKACLSPDTSLANDGLTHNISGIDAMVFYSLQSHSIAAIVDLYLRKTPSFQKIANLIDAQHP